MVMTTANIESLFDIYRFRNQQDFTKFLLYFPLGLILLIFRLVVGVLTWPFLAFLPTTSRHRDIILKGTCLALGIFIKKDLSGRNNNVKLLVCNHISILDHIVIEAALTCKQISICSHFSEWSFASLFQYAGRHSAAEALNNRINFIQRINVVEAAVAVFPESTTTNGRHGLLKFNNLPFDTAFPVQPVVLQISDMSFISISPSIIGASAWSDLLWLLFVPYTVFSLRVLPVMMKMEIESATEFSKRVQEIMASSLHVLATDYTARNKYEYRRHLATGTIPQAQPPHILPHEMSMSELNNMADRVKEILPDVPVSAILKDLGMTKSVDETVFRILEGHVFYIPENTPSNSGFGAASFPSYSSSQHGSVRKDLPPLNAVGGTFGKTPRDRMLSYQERRAALIKAARTRYFKKHGLLQ